MSKTSSIHLELSELAQCCVIDLRDVDVVERQAIKYGFESLAFLLADPEVKAQWKEWVSQFMNPHHDDDIEVVGGCDCGCAYVQD